MIFYLPESRGCSPAGDVIVHVRSLRNADIPSSRCSLVVDGWSEPDGKERKQLSALCGVMAVQHSAL